MSFPKTTSEESSIPSQPLQDCNASLCGNAKVRSVRNAKVLCQNATDLCRNDDPAHSIERSSKKVANRTAVHPLFYRRSDYGL